MRKTINLLFFILFAVMVCFPMVPEAFAQFVKVDVTKTPSKLSNWFQTQKAKCEKTLEGIQTSQFGQFIGDSIKYTKEGIKYADDLQSKTSELYGEITEKTLNSQEYKIAMISKEIATESEKLKELQEEKLKKQEEIQAEMELLKEQTSEKISNIQQNLEILKPIQEEETEDSLISEEAVKDLPEIEEDEQEKTPEMIAIEEEIKQLQEELDLQLADYESEFDAIEEEYNEKIIEQGEKIAELTQELSEVSSSSSLIKKEPRDSADALKETQEEFLLPKAPSIREENKIKKQRKDALSQIIVKVSTTKADKQLKRETTEEKTTTKADLSSTMSGESEGSGVSAEVLTEQLKILRSYIDVVLADLKLQTSIEVNRLRRVNSAPLKEKFNLCNYTDQSNVGAEGKKTAQALSGIGKIKENAAAIKENIGKAQEAAGQIKGAVTDVTNQYQEVKDTVKNGQDIMDNIDTSTIGVF